MNLETIEFLNPELLYGKPKFCRGSVEYKVYITVASRSNPLYKA